MTIFLTSLAEAFISGIIIMLYLRRKDANWKLKPKKLLWRLYLFEMTMIVPAASIETFVEKLIPAHISQGSILYLLIDNFIVIAMTEEALKYIIMAGETWKNPAFRYSFDGIVFAVITSLGFAIPENFMFILMNDGNMSVVIIRSIMAVPGHAANGVFMGYFYAKAKQAHLMQNKRSFFLNLLLSYVAPVILHGAYDLALNLFHADMWDNMLFMFLSMVLLFVTFPIEFGSAVHLIRKTAKENMAFLPEPEKLPEEIKV